MTPAGTILVQATDKDIRLYEALLERGYRLVGFPATSAAIVRRQGVRLEAADFLDRADRQVARQADAVARGMLSQLEAVLGTAEFADSTGLRGARSTAVLRDELRGALRRHLATAAYTVERFAALTAQHRLRLLLLRGELGQPMRGLLLAARERGIPSMHVMHYAPWIPSIDVPMETDMTAVYGEAAAAFLTAHGVAPERIAITGNPAWDTYRHVAITTNVAEVRRSLSLDPTLPVVMYATTSRSGTMAVDYAYPDWPWEHYRQVVTALGQLRQRRPVQLIAKLHPLDGANQAVIKRALDLASEAGVRTTLIAGHATPEHILAADLVICHESTLGIEAILLDKPVVVARFGDLFEDYLFRPQDAVLIVEDARALATTLEAALFDAETQEALAARRADSATRHNYLNDGRAWERVAALVERVLDPQARADFPAAAMPTGKASQRSPSSAALHQIDARAGALARSWYRTPVVDAEVCHRGVSLAEAVEYHSFGELLVAQIEDAFPGHIGRVHQQARPATRTPAHD